MKTKNILLGSLATLLAAGSVFATTLVPTTRVKAPLTAGGPAICRQISLTQCPNLGTQQCTVQVTNTPAGIYPAYSDVSCLTPLFGSFTPTTAVFQ
jgi:hypothetical protein